MSETKETAEEVVPSTEPSDSLVQEQSASKSAKGKRMTLKMRHMGEGLEMRTVQPGAKPPMFRCRIHHPGIPGSFVYMKKGKKRIDQVLQGWCLRNQCIGVWEVIVNCHSINPECINYTANDKGLIIDATKDTRRGFYLMVPYPSNKLVTVDVPPDDQLEADFVDGRLKCRIPVTEVDELSFLPKKKQKKSGVLSAEREKSLLIRNQKLKRFEKAQRKLKKKKEITMKKQRKNKRNLEESEQTDDLMKEAEENLLDESKPKRKRKRLKGNAKLQKQTELDLGQAIEESKILDALSDARGPSENGSVQSRKVHRKVAQKAAMREQKLKEKLKSLKKKRASKKSDDGRVAKKDSSQVSVQRTDQLVDELVGEHEARMKANAKRVLEKNTAISAMFKARSERKRAKEERKAELREKFLQKRQAKKGGRNGQKNTTESQ